MKITPKRLAEIVKEELKKYLREQEGQDPSDLPTVKTGSEPEQRKAGVVSAFTDKLVKELNGKPLTVTPKVQDKPVNLVVQATKEGSGTVQINISSKQKRSDIGLKPMPAMMGGDRAVYETYYTITTGVEMMGKINSKVFIKQGTRDVGQAFPTAAAILQVINQDVASGKSTPT